MRAHCAIARAAYVRLAHAASRIGVRNPDCRQPQYVLEYVVWHAASGARNDGGFRVVGPFD
jgi:hypothetical protein